ncbi:nucleotidyltransferase domain-containing protein [Kribbella sp. NPDC048915]|uniref:DNA polymerase beta superfamily protein n=1 Tax=Kribbella sp. NPDC048915 TaxID=3155148 RepID=UPI0033C1D585
MAREMRQLDYAELRTIVGEQPYPLLFATVSGAHLYGFPSRDSDVDLRGAHALPAADMVGLRYGPDTLDRTWYENGAEVDLVTHDTLDEAEALSALPDRPSAAAEAGLNDLLIRVRLSR